MHDTQKLYIITRNDLTPGMQAAQAVHAAFEFVSRYPKHAFRWMDQSNHICVLAVDHWRELIMLKSEAEIAGLKCILFREPDLDNEITAIAIEAHPEASRLVERLELALTQY